MIARHITKYSTEAILNMLSIKGDGIRVSVALSVGNRTRTLISPVDARPEVQAAEIQDVQIQAIAKQPSHRYFFIGGVCGLGKTTFLRWINSHHIAPIVLSDFGEACKQNPRWLHKRDNIILERLYDHYFWSRSRPWTLHDRMPFAPIIYDMVLALPFSASYEEWKRHIHQKHNFEVLDMLPLAFGNWDGVFCVFSGDSEALAERLKIRNNGIDNTMPAQYIDRQNYLFRLVAAKLPHIRLVELGMDHNKNREILVESLLGILLDYYARDARPVDISVSIY